MSTINAVSHTLAFSRFWQHSIIKKIKKKKNNTFSIMEVEKRTLLCSMNIHSCIRASNIVRFSMNMVRAKPFKLTGCQFFLFKKGIAV